MKVVVGATEVISVGAEAGKPEARVKSTALRERYFGDSIVADPLSCLVVPVGSVVLSALRVIAPCEVLSEK